MTISATQGAPATRSSGSISEALPGESLNIIGISSGYHDSACCLMKDGMLLSAVQEERFSRIKHDKSLPLRAFRYCLDQAGLTISDIDCIAY